MFFRFILISLLLAITATGKTLAAEPGQSTDSGKEKKAAYRVLKQVPLGGDGSWDYLTIDSTSRWLYIGRSNRVTVVDIDTEKIVAEIPGLQGVHGITLVPELHKGFITCGKEDLVRIFDLASWKITGQVQTGKNPDASLYDPVSQKVFVFNHGSTTASVIDTTTDKALAQIELGGTPEYGVTDGNGKVYVNLESKSEIAVIDTRRLKLLHTWTLAPGEEPTGLSIDIKHRRLFSGCSNKLMVIVDADTGKIVSTQPIGKGVDGTAFDPQSENAFSSNGDGTLTVIHETDPNSFAVQQIVQTQPGARTLALDTQKQQIWLATATPGPAEENPQSEHHRRTYVPGSFKAIVVGR